MNNNTLEAIQYCCATLVAISLLATLAFTSTLDNNCALQEVPQLIK